MKHRNTEKMRETETSTRIQIHIHTRIQYLIDNERKIWIFFYWTILIKWLINEC